MCAFSTHLRSPPQPSAARGTIECQSAQGDDNPNPGTDQEKKQEREGEALVVVDYQAENAVRSTYQGGKHARPRERQPVHPYCFDVLRTYLCRQQVLRVLVQKQTLPPSPTPAP